MIKRILALFSVSMVCSLVLVGQNLDLKDDQNNSIAGKTHYLYGNGINLSETKLHVGNSSGNNITFDARVYRLVNPSGDDWQVCFGSSCYTAYHSISGAQVISDAAAVSPATGIYNDFKVAPFGFSWTAGTWGKWLVSVVNTTDANDSSSACVIWTAGGTFAGDINSNKVMDIGELAGDINLNGVIDGAEILGDMDGSGTIDVCEVSGDANGNGIIDGGEVAAIKEINTNNVIFNSYPNPVESELSINYNVKEASYNPSIRVFDVVGKEVKSYQLSSKLGKVKLNVDDLNSGVYFYTIYVNNKALKTERVIIK